MAKDEYVSDWVIKHKRKGHCKKCYAKDGTPNLRFGACFGGYPRYCPYENK